MVSFGLRATTFAAVSIKLFPAVTGLGLMVKEPISGTGAIKRVRSKRLISPLKLVPAIRAWHQHHIHPASQRMGPMRRLM
jgi:hypothetical protein